MYVQQILTRGKTTDVRKLLKMVKPAEFIHSFSRIKKHLPLEVRLFWEEWLGDTLGEKK